MYINIIPFLAIQVKSDFHMVLKYILLCEIPLGITHRGV